MQTYIAILRGINVSGHKIIKMDALRGLFESLQFKKVKTYIQSGNVVFQDKSTDSEVLQARIAKKILDEFSFIVPVIVKSKDELASIVKNNPFISKEGTDIAKLHVTFLSAEPNKDDIKKNREGEYGPDEFIISGQTIYLHCPNTYGDTKLSNTFFEKKLKVTATTRNWKTVNELLKIATET